MAWTISAFADEAGASCDEQIEALKRANLHFIDIRGMEGHNISDLPVQLAAQVKEKLDRAGIKVQMLGSPIGKIDIADDFEIDLARLRHLGTLAPILGCKAVRIFSYYNKENRSHVDWQDESLDRLLGLRELARELGLVLYHENEREIFGDHAADVAVIGARVRDNNHFRMIFDFDNYNQSGENVYENWLKLRDQVDAIHLKDSRDKQHLPVGEGTGFVREILADAVLRGWDGPLAVEPHLSHSGAVAATGPGGIENQAYGKLPPSESFHIACEAATRLLADIGAPIA